MRNFKMSLTGPSMPMVYLQMKKVGIIRNRPTTCARYIYPSLQGNQNPIDSLKKERKED